MIRVAVVDDEPLARSGVVSRLRRHSDFQLVGEYSNAVDALSDIQVKLPDLLLLDIQMPEVDGFVLLDKLPEAVRPMVIFLTAHTEFAVSAFNVRAIDYVLKPIDDDRFDEAIDRARELHPVHLRNNSHESAPSQKEYQARFKARVGRRTKIVQSCNIDWIEADGDYAALHTSDGVYLIREPLAVLSEQLDPTKFVRVHRSTIVRLENVEEFQPLTNRDALIRLRGGAPIRVSRTYTGELFRRLNLSRK